MIARKFNRRGLRQTILAGLFILIFGLFPAVQVATDRSFVDTTASQMITSGLIWAVVVSSPAIGYLLRVRWCRYLFGALSLLTSIAWSLSPLAQHAIDRHLAFWCVWMIIEVFLAALVYTVFAGPKEPNKSPEPTSGTVTPPAEPGVAPVPPVAHL